MRNRIITAVKQRFSIRKLSIGAASVLLGTSLYFMGGSATIVHADTNVSGTETSKAAVPEQKAPAKDKIDKNKLYDIATNKNNDDTTVNDAIDKYAQVKQEEVGDNALIRASDKEPTTIATTASQRGEQVDTIAKKLDQAVKNANQEAQKINDYKNAHPNTVSGEGAQHFADQGLSIDDEPDSEINQITVDHNNKDKGNTLSKGQSETIDGIHITHTDKMTDKEQNVMKINSDNKVIVDFQHNQCSGKEITVTYDDLKNSYYLENINNKTNKIKISKIERTFSHIQEADKIRFTSDGHTPKGADGAYDECYGPQLIIYNDPSDGFFYNNITQVSVKDIYYDDQGSQINFDTKNDNNKAWIFVTSLNSNGGGNVEKVSAQGPNNSSVDVEKIAGSTVTNHNGLWYSDNNNNFGGNPDWDNRDEANRFGFVGTVAVQYHPGMTLQYSVEDWQWGSHWACTQTQVVSSLDTPVIIYDHIKDGAVPVTPKTPPTDIPKNTVKEAQLDQLTKEVHLTVNYENSDGTKFTVEPPANQNQTVTFTGTAYVDKITGELVNAKQVDGTWVVDDSKTDKPQVIWTVKDGKEDKGSFTGVTSPSEAGYYVDRVDVKVGDQQLDKDTDEYSAYTDGKDVKAVENITHNHENIVITVIYAPYQKAGLTIIDEDDIRAAEPNGHKLGSYSDTGKSGKDIAFTGAKDAVDAYLKAGYIWDSAKNKATDGTKADNYDGLKIGKLDKDASKDQNWTIYLKHGTTTFDPDKPNQPEPGAKLNPDDPNQDGPKVTKDMVDDKKQVTSTINYIVSDSKSNPAAPAAPKKNVQTATWKRTITVDNVTGHIISSTDWKTSDHYTKVDTPDLGGYYADKSSVPAPQVTQENVTTDVTYYPYQKAGLTIIDEDDIRAAEPNGHKLGSYSDTGKSGKDIAFTGAKDAVDAYLKAGYIWDSAKNKATDGTKADNYDGLKIGKLDKDASKDQNWTIYLKHGTTTFDPDKPNQPEPGAKLNPDDPNQDGPKVTKDMVDDKKQVTSTINYIVSDSKSNPAAPAAPKKNVQTATWKRTITVDNVTGHIISSTDWKTSDHYTKVDTPDLGGYYADKSSVPAPQVTQENVTTDVTYYPYQKAGLTIIDEDDIRAAEPNGHKLGSYSDTGKSGKDIAFTGAKDAVDAYLKAGYIWDSAKNKATDGTKADNYDGLKIGKLDKDASKDQNWTIYLKHGTTTFDPDKPNQPEPGAKLNPDDPNQDGPKVTKDMVDDKKQVTSTINYIVSDSKSNPAAPAAPKKNVQTATWKRTITVDNVTGHIISSTDWKTSDHYTKVDTPDLGGYYADKSSVPAPQVTQENVTTDVTYYPYQKAGLTIIDEDDIRAAEPNGHKLGSYSDTGKSGKDIAFTGAKDAVDAYLKAGYIWDSAKNKATDGTKADNYDGLKIGKLDKDASKDQNWTIYLKHGTTTFDPDKPNQPEPGAKLNPDDPNQDGPKVTKDMVDDKKQVTSTINYIVSDSKSNPAAPAAPKKNVQTATWKRTITVDNVTGHIISSTDWKTSDHYTKVDTPDLGGYYADKSSVPAPQVTQENVTTDVTYYPYQKAGLTIIDEDDIRAAEPNGHKLGSYSDTGKSGKDIAFTGAKDAVDAYLKAGYIWDSAKNKATDGTKADNYDGLKIGKLDKDASKDQNWTIYLKHGTTTFDPDKPNQPEPGAKLNPDDPNQDGPKVTKDMVDDKKQVTSTINYIVSDSKSNPAAPAAPKKNVQTATWKRTITVDNVTGHIISSTDWKTSDHYTKVDTPDLGGYYADKSSVPAPQVTQENVTTDVTYYPYQKAGLTIIDEDDIRAAEPNGHKLGSYSDTGKSGKDIAFTGAKDAVDAYLKAGYIWDSAKNKATDGTKADNYDGLKIGKLDKDASKDQNWTIYLKHGVVPVTPQTPPTVIPKNTVKEAQLDQLTKEVHLTVNYENSDGTKFTVEPPANQNQTVTFTGTAYVDKITGELVNAKQVDGTWVVDDSKTDKPQVIWTVKDGKDSFDEVISPIERGYHLTKISSHRKGNNVRAITGLTKDSGSITVTVTYTKNGKIIPIDKNDNPITGADQPVFPTDPTDPTKVDSGNIPDLSDKGYHPLDKNVKPGDPVDPDSEDPSKDITVKYVKSGTISVKYHDNTEDKDIDGYGKNASGDEDDPFNYDPATDLAKLAGKGYVLDGKVPEIPAKFTDGAQEVIINLKHGTTTVTSNNPGKPGEPVDPKNPEGPKYPNGTELDQVKRTGTQTIHYVGAGDKTPADNKQTFVFTREITFDDVTGKIISVTPWNVQSHTFGNVDTPVIPGYHADKAVAGGETVTPDDLNKVITVTYAPDGGSGDNPGSNGGGDQGTTPTPEPTPDDQPDTKLPSDNNTDKDVEKDKQDKPEKVKKARKIIKTRITKQEHIGNAEKAEKAEPLAEQEHNDQTVASPVKNEANEPQLPQTGEANTSVIGLLGMLVAGFAAILGFESSRSRKHKN